MTDGKYALPTLRNESSWLLRASTLSPSALPNGRSGNIFFGPLTSEIQNSALIFLATFCYSTIHLVIVLTLYHSFDFRIVLQTGLQVEELAVPAVYSVTGSRFQAAAVLRFTCYLKLWNKERR